MQHKNVSTASTPFSTDKCRKVVSARAFDHMRSLEKACYYAEVLCYVQW